MFRGNTSNLSPSWEIAKKTRSQGKFEKKCTATVLPLSVVLEVGIYNSATRRRTSLWYHVALELVIFSLSSFVSIWNSWTSYTTSNHSISLMLYIYNSDVMHSIAPSVTRPRWELDLELTWSDIKRCPSTYGWSIQ